MYVFIEQSSVSAGYSVRLVWFVVQLFLISFQLGSTAIGIQTNEGVVLAVEKRVTSVLIEPSSIEKILEVDEHIGK